MMMMVVVVVVVAEAYADRLCTRSQSSPGEYTPSTVAVNVYHY